ncbi:aspartic peptidase domain-containing protein [Mycena vitilis]|nr:aspartic peptidase domain-containing protein [Mycena vitilis]
MLTSRKLCVLSLLLIGSDALSMPSFPDACSRSLQPRAGAASFLPIVQDNIRDVRYATNITVNGRRSLWELHLAYAKLTGSQSSGYWWTREVLTSTNSVIHSIKTSKDFEFNDTGISMVNEYGGGPVSGTVGFATVKIGGCSFANQAFNNATSRQIGVGDVTNLGLDGLIGLAFDSNSNAESDIQNALKNKHEDDTLGEPLLFNIFDSTPQQDSFIGMSPACILDPNYLDVVTAPEVQLFPGTNGRWSVLVDSISMNNVSITLPKSTVRNAASSKVVALLDTGTENFMIPDKLLNAIYSAIPGSTYDSEIDSLVHGTKHARLPSALLTSVNAHKIRAAKEHYWIVLAPTRVEWAESAVYSADVAQMGTSATMPLGGEQAASDRSGSIFAVESFNRCFGQTMTPKTEKPTRYQGSGMDLDRKKPSTERLSCRKIVDPDTATLARQHSNMIGPDSWVTQR